MNDRHRGQTINPRRAASEQEAAINAYLDATDNPHAPEHESKEARGRRIREWLAKPYEPPAPPPARRRHITAQSPRWVDDLMTWCRDRGIDTDEKIAAFLKVRRETLWHWRQGRTPRPKSITLIISKTEGDIDPRKPSRRRRPNVANGGPGS